LAEFGLEMVQNLYLLTMTKITELAEEGVKMYSQLIHKPASRWC
jgi:hypothetical protein